MIKLKNLSKTFNGGETFAVKDLTLTINKGEILVILGSSGCGKSTTLRMINRLIEPTSGAIEINGRAVCEYNPIILRRSIGYVFQDIGLFPHMTVEENIAVVLRLLGKSREERLERARVLLKLVNLNPENYAKRMISELSGGQQQRVGVARALANEPSSLLMDEPFGALDSITRNNLQEEILSLNAELQKTIVFVTHDIAEALRLADRIAVMDQGKLLQVGNKEEILEKPANEFVHQLFKTPANQFFAMADSLKIAAGS